MSDSVVKIKWYEESPGVISSKRLFGGFILATGWAMKIGLFFLAVFGKVNDPGTASAQADSLVYAGAGLLGLTIVDNATSKLGGGQ
jgi:hypothetical protein